MNDNQIYVNIVDPWSGTSRLFTVPGNLDALHVFACELGLSSEGFSNDPRPHYALDLEQYYEALAWGGTVADGQKSWDVMKLWRAERAKEQDKQNEAT